MTPLHERRRHPRLENSVPVKICCDEFDLVTETRNLSCAGAYCRVNKPLELMTKLKIHLLLPVRKKSKMTTKKISCQGVVVRVESQETDSYYNVAIYFSDMLLRDRKHLSQYVNSNFSCSPP